MRVRRLKHKYNAQPTEVDGIRFDSKKEARYYRDLKLRQAAGEVVMFLRQVPLHLPGGVTMRIDFQVFEAGGDVRFIDTKGVRTEAWNAKKKIAENKSGVRVAKASAKNRPARKGRRASRAQRI